MERLAELRQRFFQEPLAASFGIGLERLADGEAELKLIVKDEHGIVGGVAQGGVTTVLADYAGVYAAMTRIPAGHTPAKHIAIDLLRPVRVGDTVRASARVAAETRSTVIVAIDVTGEDGRQRAYAVITFAKPKP